jgi:hypothetical protein
MTASRTQTTAAKAAREIRKELKANFPNVKFSVKSKNYSSGNSIDVTYTDAITRDKVAAIVDKYQYGSFNGMEAIYENTNVNEDIPQVRHTFVNREMSEATGEHILNYIRNNYNGCENADYFSYIDAWGNISTQVHKLFTMWEEGQSIEEIKAEEYRKEEEAYQEFLKREKAREEAAAKIEENAKEEITKEETKIIKLNTQPIEVKETTVEISLGNIGSEEQAKKIASKLQGQTYYDFQVHYSSCAGNYPVTVTTDYKGAKEEEVRQMLMFCMACEM